MCSHFLQWRDPKTGVFGCYLCREKPMGPSGPIETKDPTGADLPASGPSDNGAGGPVGTIMCHACMKRTKILETIPAESPVDIKFRCAECLQLVNYILAFKQDA